MDERTFRDVMGKFTTGITIVTTKHNDKIMGMTVNAFMSISLDPILIAISIDEDASMYNTLLENKQFGVSILKDEQQDISMVFAKQKEEETEIIYKNLDNNPVIDGSLATLSCYVKDTVKAGDHMILIAEVTDLTMDEGEPILYFGGEYRKLK